MQMAETYSDELANSANLSVHALEILAAPSTPESARDEIESLLVDDEMLLPQMLPRTNNATCDAPISELKLLILMVPPHGLEPRTY